MNHIQDSGEMTSLDKYPFLSRHKLISALRPTLQTGKASCKTVLELWSRMSPMTPFWRASIWIFWCTLDQRMLESAFFPCHVLTLFGDLTEENSSVCAPAFACVRNYNPNIDCFSSRVRCWDSDLHCGMWWGWEWHSRQGVVQIKRSGGEHCWNDWGAVVFIIKLYI